uniref:Putative tubby C-terminal-like domain-containing protein n=2 Tax=Helianthus annuus TaxID=4232 RepID=A0A251S453_HELAN
MGDEETEDYCDFKIKGNWFDQSCTIYGTDGFTSIPGNPDIAKMIMMNPKHLSIGQEKFGVLIYPEVDHAFIVALVLIMKLTRDIDLRKHCSHGW